MYCCEERTPHSIRFAFSYLFSTSRKYDRSLGNQQTGSYELPSWGSHPRRVRRRPRLSGYGSIIVTVTCHGSPRRVISQSWHKRQPLKRGTSLLLWLEGSSPRENGKVFVEGYSIVNERKILSDFLNGFGEGFENALHGQKLISHKWFG